MAQSGVVSSKYQHPQLILISGCTGAGKSTFGVALAAKLGISRVVSTDSVRSILRSALSETAHPALYRSSYGEGDTSNIISNWKECCEVLQPAIISLLDDSLLRGTSLILEGVHIVPQSTLLDRWKIDGGRAVGCLLTVSEETAHRKLLMERATTTQSITAPNQLRHFDRIRDIQTEMIRLAEGVDWKKLNQYEITRPMNLVNEFLSSCTVS